MSATDLVRGIFDQLNRIFRHVLPGLVVVAGARVAHPKWFCAVLDLDTWPHLVVLAAWVVLAGNCAYVIHRYTVHQLLGFFCYRCKKRRCGGYFRWLYKHISRSFLMPDGAQDLRKHVHLRSAQVIFMFITGYVLLLFSLWHESASFFAEFKYPWFWPCVAGLVLIASVVQYCISNGLDVHVVKRHSSQRQDSTDKCC